MLLFEFLIGSVLAGDELDVLMHPGCKNRLPPPSITLPALCEDIMNDAVKARWKEMEDHSTSPITEMGPEEQKKLRATVPFK